jgi:hypothetical protein
MLPILFLTPLKDQFLVLPDVARCSTVKDEKHSPSSNPLTFDTLTPAHSGTVKDQYLMQNTYFQLARRCEACQNDVEASSTVANATVQSCWS